MLLIKASRFVLFGGDKMPEKPTLPAVLRGKGANMGRGLLGLPPVARPGFGDLVRFYGQSWLAWLLGKKEAEDINGVPMRLWTVVDNVVKNRGGIANKETGAYNFWAGQRGCSVNPVMWSIPIEYAPSADPKSFLSMEMALEDQLTRIGYDVNVRLLTRPLRLEVDRPTVQTVRLADYWQYIAALPVDKRLCAPAVSWLGDKTRLVQLELADEDFSLGIFGSPGSGKSQLAMSLLLSLCYTNSPASLALILCDPKVVDFRSLNDHGLPHLVAPVATEPNECAALILAAEKEMDARTQQARTGDTSFLSRSICLYIDELADLMGSLDNGMKDSVTAALQRLTQKGRGVGFIVIEATQRVYEVDAKLYSKLGAKLVGRTRNAPNPQAAGPRRF
jgi:hypothetical protein